MSFLETEGPKAQPIEEFGLLTFNTYANLFEDGRLDNSTDGSYRPFYGNINDGALSLSHRDRASGQIEETYNWQIQNGQLTIEKWELIEGEMKKTMIAELRKR